jgi:hypothetical protein
VTLILLSGALLAFFAVQEPERVLPSILRLAVVTLAAALLTLA